MTCFACLLAVFTAAALAAPGGASLPLTLPADDKPDETPPAPQPHVELTYLSVNTTVMLNQDQVRHKLSLRGDLHLPAESDIVGVARQIELTELVDDAGNNLLDDQHEAQRNGMIRVNHGSRNMMALGAMKRGNNTLDHVSVTASLQLDRPVPPRFSVIRGHTRVLEMDKHLVQRFEPVRPGGLVRVTNDLSMRIDKVEQDKNELSVELAFEAVEQVPFFNCRADAFVSFIRLVDQHGETVGYHGWSVRGTGNQGNLHTGAGTVKFRLSSEQQPAALELVVITRTQEKRIDFELKDVELRGPTE